MTETQQAPGFHPLYLQIKELLIQRVLSGHWRPGEALPSEMKLALEYRVSQGTVRKALEEMAAEHLVVRHQGKGTFVSARETETPVHFFSIVTIDDHPVTVGPPVVFEYAEGPATEKEVTDLQLMPGDSVYRIFRVRTMGGRPELLEDIVIAADRFRGLPEMLQKSARMNSYLIMEKEFGVLAVRAEEWVDAVAASARDAQIIAVREGAPLLRISRVAYALDGRPAECRTMTFSTTRFRYRNTLR